MSSLLNAVFLLVLLVVGSGFVVVFFLGWLLVLLLFYACVASFFFVVCECLQFSSITFLKVFILCACVFFFLLSVIFSGFARCSLCSLFVKCSFIGCLVVLLLYTAPLCLPLFSLHSHCIMPALYISSALRTIRPPFYIFLFIQCAILLLFIQRTI